MIIRRIFCRGEGCVGNGKVGAFFIGDEAKGKVLSVADGNAVDTFTKAAKVSGLRNFFCDKVYLWVA